MQNIKQVQSFKQVIDLETTRKCELKIRHLKNQQREITTFPFSWYFIVKTEDFKKREKGLIQIKQELPLYLINYVEENEQWTRIYCKYPERRNVIEIFKNAKIQTYEADLSLSRRYWIDATNELAAVEDFDILYFDIETDDTVSGLFIGRDRVLCMTAKDNNGNEFLIMNDSEKELLSEAIALLARYDIISGWNSKNYDIPYLTARCEKYGLKFPNTCHIDMMSRMIHAYRFDTNIRSFSLNNIAKIFLGKEKPRTKKIIDLYLNYPDQFKKYALDDVRLLQELDDKHKVLQMVLKQAHWCNVVPRSLGQSGAGLYTLLDNVILKAAHKRNIKGLTPKYTFDELSEMSKEAKKEIDYQGPIVLDAKPGLYDHLYMFDFKTMYPNNIISANIGFDTLDPNGDITLPSGVRFNSKPDSILVEVLTELLTKRKEYKTKKLELIEQGLKGTPEFQTVQANEVIAKELGNSVYGIMGAKWGRYFTNREVVESIIEMARYLLLSLEEFSVLEGFNVITGDTDSVMITKGVEIDTQAFVDKYQAWLEVKLKKELNITKSTIKLDFDKYFRKFIIVAKKNYAGHLVNQEGREVDYVHIKGLQAIKSDTCKLASDVLKELINKLLKETHDSKYYEKWIKDKRDHIFDNVVATDISIHKKIAKINLNDYKNKPLSVIIAQRKLAKGEIMIHREVDYIITGRGTNKRLDGVDISEFTGNFDAAYYWDKCILSVIARMLNVVYLRTDWDRKTYYSFAQKSLF